MCLAVPGEVMEIYEPADGLVNGKVRFGGIFKDICLSYVPEVKVGDYVIVHVGFALNTLDEEEAKEVFKYLGEMVDLADVEDEETEGERQKAEGGTAKR